MRRAWSRVPRRLAPNGERTNSTMLAIASRNTIRQAM